MKNNYQLFTAICIFLVMAATSNAEDIQNVAPPVTQSKDTGTVLKRGMDTSGMHRGPGLTDNMQNVPPPVAPPKDGAGMQHGGMGMGMHHGMGGMGGMMAGMSDEQKEKHMRDMQEHMLKMHDLSNQILAEKDATKKEALKKQQLDLMKSHHADMMERHQQMQ